MENLCTYHTLLKLCVCVDHKLSEASGGVENGEDHTLDEGGASTDGDEDGDEGVESETVPVDENLFTGEDLDELEEELNTLDLSE